MQAYWVSSEVQQDSAGDCKMIAPWLRTSKDDVGSNISSRNRDLKPGLKMRRSEALSRADASYKTDALNK